jgi:hypothetical protein
MPCRVLRGARAGFLGLGLAEEVGLHEDRGHPRAVRPHRAGLVGLAPYRPTRVRVEMRKVRERGREISGESVSR